MVQGEGVECRRDGARVEVAGKGYDHFAS
jgi:hypothetical protein